MVNIQFTQMQAVTSAALWRLPSEDCARQWTVLLWREREMLPRYYQQCCPRYVCRNYLL